MSLNMIYRITVLIFFFFGVVGCGSSKIIPTKDVCSVKKHWKDNIFQVQINGNAINQNYYTFDEAKEITKLLASQNKCMP